MISHYFPKHKNVSVDCIFSSLRPYVVDRTQPWRINVNWHLCVLVPLLLVDEPSATELVHFGLIPGWLKLTTIKINIHTFPTWRSLKGLCEAAISYLTWRPRSLFAVSWPTQLGNSRRITVPLHRSCIVKERKALVFFNWHNSDLVVQWEPIYSGTETCTT